MRELERNRSSGTDVPRVLLVSTLVASIISFFWSVAAVAQVNDGASDDDAIEMIIVTATRKEASLSTVPISIAAFTQKDFEERGLKEFADVVRLTPGISLGPNNRIAIRGISSTAGAATTGVYIDDVPIQVRQVGYSATPQFPSLFDLERVEVLRGPQGTLFGSGSQGGTVRFIQPTPSFDEHSGRVRVEGTTMQGQGSGYEIGAAFGGPIINDKLAFRVSGYFRHDPGYIDRVIGQAFVKDPTMEELGYKSMGFNQTGTAYTDSNWSETSSARAALSWRATDNLTATLSVNYQYRFDHDDIGSVWSSITDSKTGQYQAPVFPAGDANEFAYLSSITAPELNTGDEKMVLPYLNIDWSNDDVRVISTTSMLDHDSYNWTDNTIGYGFAYIGYDVPRPGDQATNLYTDSQENFTQEIRVQNINPESRLQWSFGTFYSRSKQGSIQSINTNMFENIPSLFGIGPNSDPFPGTSAFLNAFGAPLGDNGLIYYADFQSDEEQLAGFGEVEFLLTPEVTLTFGARYARNELAVDIYQDGPENNLNAPFGSPCTTPGGCTPGEGEWTPEYVREEINAKENIFTPKFGLSWQSTPDTLLYAVASKGFRPGGGQERLPGVCNDALIEFGYTDDAGNPLPPTQYKSDTVWNYEVGSKTQLFDRRLTVDGSVYVLKWDEIQTRIGLPDCGYGVTDNLGKATSKGFDVSVNIRANDSISLLASAGYNSTKFDVTTTAFTEGDYVPGTGSPWVVRLAGDYVRPFGNDMEFFARFDAVYNNEIRLTGTVNPNSPSYQPLDEAPPASTIVNARTGVRFANVDLTLFAKNLFDYDDRQGINHVSPGRVLYLENYLQPRTIGISVSASF